MSTCSQHFRPESFRLSNPELFRDPYPAYRMLREQAPVHYSSMYGGSWVLSAYDDVAALLQDPRLTNDRATLPLMALPAGQRGEFSDIVAALKDWVAFFDGEPHAVQRQHMDQVFRILAPSRMLPVIQEVVDHLIDAWGTRNRVDLVADFARPLPAMVITRLLGAPAADHELLARWSDDIAYLFGASDLTLTDVRRGQASIHAFAGYLEDLATQVAGSKPGSLLGRLLSSETAGFRFTEAQARAQCMLLMFAGLEPTRYLVANAVWSLDEHPDQKAMLLSDPRLWTAAVEEFLRHDTPVQYIGRMAAESFEYRGHHIEKGQVVMLLAGSANRDPKRFPEPDRLDIRRAPNPHLAFGRGPHHCIGAGLVRLQTKVALRALFDRVPDLRICQVPTPVWNTNLGFHGFHSLTVSVNPTTS